MTLEDHKDHRKRLREKYQKSGFMGFHDYEKIELLLTYAIPRKDVKPEAKRLLKKFGSLGGLLDADLDELCEVKGISANSAILLKLLKELCAEYLGEEMAGKNLLSCPDEVYNFARMKMASLKEEAFMVVYLNAQNYLIDYEIVNEGTVDYATIYPRNIIKKALKKNATGIIAVHNHPSGICDPSSSDLALTKTLKDAVKTVNVRLLDHVIVGKSGHFSLVEEGLL